MPTVCPNQSNHTSSPDGYIAWHEWGEKMGKTHKQIKCEGCGLLVIWIKKGKK